MSVLLALSYDDSSVSCVHFRVYTLDLGFRVQGLVRKPVATKGVNNFNRPVGVQWTVAILRYQLFRPACWYASSM